VLNTKGRVSKVQADSMALREYEFFNDRRRGLAEAEGERALQASLETAARQLPESKSKREKP
jgi:hypothetical protein